MRYADQHMHSLCSPDAHAAMTDMAAAARDAGMAALCFTDHIDMADELTGHTKRTFAERWPGMCAAREAYRAHPVPGIEARFGMELGAPLQGGDESALAASQPELDFVIGSVHNLPDVTDFYWYPYKSETECEALDRRYLSELLRTAECDCFDVMGHVGYTSRYMARAGFREAVTVEKYGDELRALFRRLIERGKGIEANASGFASGAATYPPETALRLYRSLGGEIITVGSDAHTVARAGAGVRQAYALLRRCGFRYICEFRERKPVFIPLD